MRARLTSRRDLFGPGQTRNLRWFALFIVFSLGALHSSAPAARGDIQEPNSSHARGAREQRREQPALAVPQKEAIDLGGSVEITLRSRGQIGKWIDFSIQSEPAHGSLAGPPRQLTRDTAVVTYVHHADDGPGTDTFTYSVQAAHSAVSAPAQVSIEIRDSPPSIVATPAELDFGAVRVGDTSGAELVLQNQGGGEAVGRLFLPSPWIVDGSADYRLARGQSQSFRILFAPRSGRSFSESISLVAETGAPTHLLGTGLGAPAGAGGAKLASNAASASGPGASSGPAGAGRAVSPRDAAAASALAAAAASANSAQAAAPGPGHSGGGESADPLQGLQVPTDEAPAGTAAVALDNSGYITLYDSGLKNIKLLRAGETTLDVSWRPLTPAPKIYRVELRYLTQEDGKLRIDWRPYTKVEIHRGENLCTATISRLPSGRRQTLRIVAIDFSGRVAGGSATLQAATLSSPSFWRVTPLRVLVAILLVCLGLIWRRRWEDRQILREIDQSRAAREKSADFLYRS